ncbi:MAG TPA: prolipoprotein diacylglyceryl transferase family protein [Candidatus Dormibacteraeota bacterium]|nr:prolipoprotein diacylglyceryl transferase family protein [Candidatus Dormibacteraeota bacterium]
MLAVIRLDFDPYLHLHGWLVLDIAWATLALAGAILLAILVAARFARRSGRLTGLSRLRLDDLLFVVVGAVPGAVVGARLLYALDYWPYYSAHPEAVVDPSQGGLSLLGAVLGGTLTAAIIARVLEDPPRRWLDMASVALLVAIGLGKLSMLLIGAGQGQFWAGSWAVAFDGDWPWLSAAPAIPAHPAQAYEGLWALAGIVAVLVVHAGPLMRRLPGGWRQEGTWASNRQAMGLEVAPGRLRFGYAYAFAVAWWLGGRVAIASLWRDEAVAGPFNAEQAWGLVVLALIAIGAVISLVHQPRPIEPEARWRVGHRRWRLRGG